MYAISYAPVIAAAASGSSFSCAAASSRVERAICADAGLAALDRALALTFGNMLGQGGIDAVALRGDEDAWRTTVRDRCATNACIAAAYRARNTALREMSLKAASPAAYEDTRPFPAPASVAAAAQALVGGSCATRFTNAAREFPGFGPPSGPRAHSMPVIFRNASILIRESHGVRFAFLLTGEGATCRIAGAAALPVPATTETVLQCSLDADGSSGFGIGHGASEALVAFWSIQPGSPPALVREPIHVLGVSAVRCQEPETGE